MNKVSVFVKIPLVFLFVYNIEEKVEVDEPEHCAHSSCSEGLYTIGCFGKECRRSRSWSGWSQLCPQSDMWSEVKPTTLSNRNRYSMRESGIQQHKVTGA